MHLSPICPEVSVKFCSPLAVFTGSPLYLFVLFVRTERGLGRSCDVLKVVTDGARKAYARGPWSERDSSRESSGRRSYRFRLVYFDMLVDREYSAERRLNMAQLVSRTYDC